jgi:hypothetical protein
MRSQILKYTNNMQKRINIIGIGFVIGLMALAACHGRIGVNKSMKGIQELPSFTVLTLDSSHMLRSQDIPDGRPIVLFLFDPTCSHCQKLTAGILDNVTKLKNVRFYFISNSDPKDVDSFTRNYHLATLSNVFVGMDYQYSFFNAFTPSTIPYVAIYTPRRSLARIFNGEADIDSVIHYSKSDLWQ